MAETTPKIDPNTPLFQPAGYDPAAQELAYENQSILWWDNGIWGQAGYAIPNCGGKPSSANETCRELVAWLGRELFALMHLPDVRFTRPPNADWLFRLNKLCTLGIKRMGDLAVGWTDTRKGDAQHAANTRQAFTAYPVPYFGQRIRQRHARKWAGQVMILISDVVQHSDNDYDDDITQFLASRVQSALLRIQQDLATAFLGYTREQTEAPGFVIPTDAFSVGKYKPDELFTDSELIEERMPDDWWPSTNDLTPINGIPWVVAKIFGKPWPEAGDFGDGGALEAAWPAGGIGVIKRPGSR